ncbi:MAG: 30S ribosomal protein S7 [Thermoplasmata archaeon]
MAKAKEGEKAPKGAKGSRAAPQTAKKAPAKKAPAKTAPSKEAPAKKAAPKKTPAKKPAAGKKEAPKKTTKKPAAQAKAKPTAKAAKKEPAKKKTVAKATKKEPAKKETPKKAAAKKKAPAKKKEPTKKLAKEAPKKAPAKKPAAKKPAAGKGPPKPKAPPKPKPEVSPGTEDGLLLFNRWDLGEVEVSDPGLRRYMNLTPTYLPHTGGRWANRPFTKARVNLVERFVNNMMRTERYTGKKNKTIKVVQGAFELVEKRAKRNPVQVLVDGLEKAAPREEVTRLRFGGISVPRAVDIAPARRLDLALRNITTGAVRATFKTPKSASQCLANEILMASEGDINSYAIGKKEEMERIAGSAR